MADAFARAAASRGRPVRRTGERYPAYLLAPGRTVASLDELADALG